VTSAAALLHDSTYQARLVRLGIGGFRRMGLSESAAFFIDEYDMKDERDRDCVTFNSQVLSGLNAAAGVRVSGLRPIC